MTVCVGLFDFVKINRKASNSQSGDALRKKVNLTLFFDFMITTLSITSCKSSILPPPPPPPPPPPHPTPIIYTPSYPTTTPPSHHSSPSSSSPL
ncbi:MAG: hypothetical protein FWG98_06020, partial [Candidatus Cloacimonetes bacterium]|nr:hypothetical protein [Candidatus Cloacimonadota bacterium]